MDYSNCKRSFVFFIVRILRTISISEEANKLFALTKKLFTTSKILMFLNLFIKFFFLYFIILKIKAYITIEFQEKLNNIHLLWI